MAGIYDIVTGLTRRQKHAILMLLDVLLVPVALYLALLAQFGGGPLPNVIWTDWEIVPVLMGTAGLLAYSLGLHRIQLNDTETVGLLPYAQQALIIGLAGGGLSALADGIAPWSAFLTFGLLLFLGSVAARLGMRWLLLRILHMRNPRRAVLIYGAGRTGMQLAAALRHDQKIVPVAFVDDNPAMRRMTVAGLPVLGPADLEVTLRRKRITRVLLAMPSLTAPQKLRISRRLAPLGVDVHALPSFAQLAGEEGLVDKLKPVDPADLLQRSQFDDDLADAEDIYRDKAILVTGAGGSIGSELCRQLLACRPKRLVLLDNSELALYTIDIELSSMGVETEIVPVLGSVEDGRLCRHVIAANGIDVILHAAAYKHVPLVERNPLMGLANNVFGTKTLADAAREMGVKRFLLVSTDKAVRPANVMGASKRLAEMVVQDLASRPTETLFSMVRFGNVLGSSGSVIPLFEEQIANGGPITLTHRDVTRYFMTIPEAARLVLISGALTRGGDVFVLDMGKPVPISHLARRMIESAGYSVREPSNPDGDIEIQITGLRLGEKLHEELLIAEGSTITRHPKITRAREDCLSEIEVATALRELNLAIEAADEAAARAVLRRWIEGAMESGRAKHG